MNEQKADSIEEVPVLIVGGGPAGLTAALELSRRGIDGLLVERRDFTSHFPRAHLLNVRTMETFADIGVADDVYRLSPPEHEWHRVAWYTSLSGPTELHGRRIGYVDAWGGGSDLEQYERASPRKFANVPQIRLDRVLWEHADRAWPGSVRARSELTALDIDDAGALATITDHATGGSYQVRARYVVAADGGRTVTDLLGVGVSGPRALIDHVSVYFSGDLSAFADEEALLTYFVRPEGQGTFAGALLGLGPERWGRNCTEWLVGMSFHLSDPALEDEESLVARAKELIGIPDLQMDVHKVSHWQFEGVVAERFRVGPVFIVGDAAHRHPPTGGLGLNTAVGDASNLAWKIAAVLQGHASDRLLDSYESERQQIAAQNVGHSLRNAGRHAPVAEAMGLHRGIGIEQGWAEIGIWAGDTPEGEHRRVATADAIAANRENFSQLGIEAGFTYREGALVPDRFPASAATSASAFVSNTTPGHHVPHVWVTRGEESFSTSDLVAPTGLTLFIDPTVRKGWTSAALASARTIGAPITVVSIGPDGDYQDPKGEWALAREVGEGGAVLVRPDRHVAWRTHAVSEHQDAALTEAMRAVLDPDVRTSTDESLLALRAIEEAGEALRMGDPERKARIFSERGA